MMTYQILDDNDQFMDARTELDARGLTVHSRGGSTARANVTNAQYGPALRLVLRRIAYSHLPFEAAWVDSFDAQRLPVEERIILSRGELDAEGSTAFTLMSKRMKLVGQRKGLKGGNSTKRIRIQFSTEVALSELTDKLRLVHVADIIDRLPTNLFETINAEHIWNALEKLRQPEFEHAYGPSTDYDLVTDQGERFPPKAVFGLAATEALSFNVLPKHFSGGLGTICFRTLERAGYIIVPKNQPTELPDFSTSNEDRLWTEGKPRLVAHLRKERASGLAQAKKDSFLRKHGRLFCERCQMDPIAKYGGPHGLACIEVHHGAVLVEDMTEGHKTKLDDLECLCANCHRVEHRRIKIELETQNR
ncbi:hypothetical protein ABIF68_003515 [Bradyrhizobium japonicum]|uniref:HNH endonuclease n=1 Tax=Bradyrhizobium TaxID=374 RepID=UPI0006763AD2|nr:MULTISPECIES: HNH endonuclease [Bradyrhizobium]MDI2077961.1 HNH endonuclease [Bradyrhizobium sp. Mp27]